MDFLSQIKAFNEQLRADISGGRSDITQTGCHPVADNEYIPLRIIIIDRSYSMGHDDYPPSRLQAAIGASEEYVNALSKQMVRTAIAVISFGFDSKLVLPPTDITNLQIIKDALRSLPIHGGTNIGSGLKMAEQLLAGYLPDQHKQIVLLTDGYGNCPLEIPENIKLVHNTVIDVVGIGGSPKDVDEKFLKKIATTDSDGMRHYRFIKDTQKLNQHYRQLAGGILWKGNAK